MVNENSTLTSEKSAKSSAETTHIAPQCRILRMRQGNLVTLSQIPFSPEMFHMCEEMELVEVKPVLAYDSDNHPIPDKIEAVNYICVDGKNWFTFKIPNQTKAVIAQEEIDRRDAKGNPVLVKIPLDKIVFKPYQTPNDRGTLHMSLQIPYIELL